jgi:hypothetical protein
MSQQKRIVTVRECARAQGFPDHYEFLSANKEPSKVVQDVRATTTLLTRVEFKDFFLATPSNRECSSGPNGACAREGIRECSAKDVGERRL